MEKTIFYFETSGPVNTDKTLDLAKKRAVELGIKDIVIATTHGNTALKAADVFHGIAVDLIAVTISEAFQKEGWVMTRAERTQLQARGIKVFTGLHALGDNVASAYTEKFGGIPTESVVRETLYRFSQGMKVCVEIALMAADAGLIDVNREAIAIAGAGNGADTAIVIKPTCSMNFLNLEIREIIAKPRIP